MWPRLLRSHDQENREQNQAKNLTEQKNGKHQNRNERLKHQTDQENRQKTKTDNKTMPSCNTTKKERCVHLYQVKARRRAVALARPANQHELRNFSLRQNTKPNPAVLKNCSIKPKTRQKKNASIRRPLKNRQNAKQNSKLEANLEKSTTRQRTITNSQRNRKSRNKTIPSL